MPDLASLELFAAAAFVLTATPGPDMLLIASRSISQGRSSGFLTWAGIAVGTYVHALAAALGLSQLFLAVPIAYEIVRWAGCLYMLYLAYRTLRSSGTALILKTSTSQISPSRIFLEGLGTNILNPKMAIFVLSLFPQFVPLGSGGLISQILLLATILNVSGFLVNGAVILFVSRVGKRIAGLQRFPRLPQYLLATVFAGLACRLAWGTSRS